MNRKFINKIEIERLRAWKTTLLWTLMLVFLPMAQVTTAQNGPLIGTLTRRPGQATFQLHVRNVSRNRIGVCLYRWLYELRLFDASGHKLTDEKSFLMTAKLKPPSAQDYAVIAPGQSASLLLVPIGAGKYGILPTATRKADCVERAVYRRWAQENTPSVLRKADIKLYFITTTPALQIK